MRTYSHSLRIHTGRYNRLERNLGLCQLCDSNEIEDEFHFIFKCTYYDQVSNRYIKPFYRNRSNMIKFIQLLNTQNKNATFTLCKYIKEAWKVWHLLFGNICFVIQTIM